MNNGQKDLEANTAEQRVRFQVSNGGEWWTEGGFKGCLGGSEESQEDTGVDVSGKTLICVMVALGHDELGDNAKQLVI